MPNSNVGTLSSGLELPLSKPNSTDAGSAFQERVLPWLQNCFGATIANDLVERNHRFLEEALELVQACGCTAAEGHNLVDYVFGRPVGDKAQEVGGLMVTLAALCSAHGLDMDNAAEVELARISEPETVLRIREKQMRKPSMSALPGSYPDRVPLVPRVAAITEVAVYRSTLAACVQAEASDQSALALVLRAWVDASPFHGCPSCDGRAPWRNEPQCATCNGDGFLPDS